MRVDLKFLLLFSLINICCFCLATNVVAAQDTFTWNLLKTRIEYHQKNNPDSVFFYLKKADSLSRHDELNSKDQLFLMNSWGNYYSEMQPSDTAIVFFDNALRISKMLNDQDLISDQLFRLAEAYNDHYVSDSALKYYQMSLARFRKNNDPLSVASALSG